MRIITLNSILKIIMRKKKELLLFMVAFVVFFSFMAVSGIRSTKKQLAEAKNQYELDMAEYDGKISEFDTTKETLNENLVTLQKQYDDQNEYCNESVFMKLDGNNVQFGELQIQISDPNGAVNYVNSSAFRSLLASKLKDIDEKYIKDLLSAGNNGGTVTITALHYDREIAEQMKDIIKEILIDWAEEKRLENEDFEYLILSEAVSARTDLSIINAQNSALSNLQTYTSKVADVKKQIAANDRNKEKYIKETSIEPVREFTSSDKVKMFIKYFILAIIVAIIADAGWIVMCTTFGKKVLTTDWFAINHIPVSGNVLQADCDASMYEKIATDLYLTMKSRGNEGLYLDFSGLQMNEERQTIVKKLGDALQTRGLDQLHAGSVCTSDIKALEQMSDAGMIALLIAIEGTTYSDLEKTMEYISKYQKTVSQVILWR